jgi:arylsulfatase A-like enzyme
LILQFGFIFSKSNSFINAIPLPVSIYAQLIATLLIHLCLYVLVSALQTALMWGVIKRTALYHDRWHIIIWSLSVCALLSTNGYFFPLSLFSRLFLPELPNACLLALMICSLLILSLLSLNALFLASKHYPRAISGGALLFLGLFIYGSMSLPIEKEQTKDTNIIFIGVDSLSPHYINTTRMPAIADFAQQSVLFKETISPLARTYPAWSSILTGLYPHHHHADYNLMPPDLVKSSLSVAWSLRRLGYQTIFATDDRRFNNIGEDFGFQNIIGPKMGVNDMLLGTFNDFPLSNLLVNYSISRWLFPYNYINRASHFTYYPQSFDKQLRDTLLSRSKTSPLFLAVHFTLPHWPYAWAASSPAQVDDEYSIDEREQLYLASLQRVDQQVANLLRELKQQGYLENSMVVLLSDHGEALYEKGSRQTSSPLYQGKGTSAFAGYLKRKTSTELDKSVGHGSDLLSTDQYHCLLAFKIYKQGHLITKPKIIDTRVALLDITPTIQSFIGIPANQPLDGISLLASIVGQNTLKARAFIMESGMLPNQFLSRDKARILGQKFFTVHSETGQLQVKKKELATLDALKLYAVLQGNWVLALYPDDSGYMPILLNLQDGKWSDNLNTDFAKNSPALNMLQELHQFYNKKWSLIKTSTFYASYSP